MRDLRKQALESHKTVSKKAQAKLSLSSRPSSKTTSRTTSRNISRHASDEEDANFSDSTTWSNASFDDILVPEVPADPEEGWKQDLGDRVEEIIDRKRSSVQGREATLTTYNTILMLRYAHDEIEHKTTELFPALMKSVKAESSEKETCLALKAIALTLITVPSDRVYDVIYQILKKTYTSSEFDPVKAAAIHTLSAAAVYGGASETEMENIMDDFLAIVESDGNSIEAADSSEVVTAACEAWGLLATFLDDMEENTQIAMDAFVEQLESSDITVQVAAGENIALLYEKSYTPREVDDGPAGELEFDANGHPLETGLVKRYEPYRQKPQLEHTLRQLAKESSRRISKRDRKILHVNFSDILTTIEHPPRGPRYSKALSNETQSPKGSRMVVKIGEHGVLYVNKWWKLHRLQALKRILGGGFAVHYEQNEVVLDTLPMKVTKRSS